MFKFFKTKTIVGKIKNKIVIQGEGLKNGIVSKITIQDNPRKDGIFFNRNGLSSKVNPEILHGSLRHNRTDLRSNPFWPKV